MADIVGLKSLVFGVKAVRHLMPAPLMDQRNSLADMYPVPMAYRATRSNRPEFRQNLCPKPENLEIHRKSSSRS